MARRSDPLLAVRLPAEILAELDRLAEAEHRSRAGQVAHLIEQASMRPPGSHPPPH